MSIALPALNPVINATNIVDNNSHTKEVLQQKNSNTENPPIYKKSGFYGIPKFTQRIYTSLSILVVILFATWWFQPSHIPSNFLGTEKIFDFILFILVSFVIWHPIIMDILTWIIASHIKDIRRQKPVNGSKVAFITTIVPGSESIDLLHKCLPAMVKAQYPHDTWLLDEGNAPDVISICKKYGVLYLAEEAIVSSIKIWKIYKNQRRKS